MSGALVRRRGVVAGGGPTTIYGVTDTEAFAAHNSFSISRSVSLGTAHADREIWVVITTMESGDGSNEILTPTVGGNPMTKVFETSVETFSNAIGIAYWKYKDDGALGTSATVEADFDGEQVHSGVIVFSVSGEAALLDSHSDTTDGANPSAGTINTSEDGWAFYCAVCQNAGGGPIATFSNDTGFDMGTNEVVVFGFNSPENDGTVSVDRISGDGNQNRAISGISTIGV
jgi:hypothetical protein